MSLRTCNTFTNCLAVADIMISVVSIEHHAEHCKTKLRALYPVVICAGPDEPTYPVQLTNVLATPET